MRNFLLKLDRKAAFNFRMLEEELCRADDQIVVAGGKRGIVAAEIDPTILLFDLDLVIKRHWRDQRLEFMEAVFSLSKNAQGEINLGRGENFHLHNFLCHSDPSRGISLLVAAVYRTA